MIRLKYSAIFYVCCLLLVFIASLQLFLVVFHDVQQFARTDNVHVERRAPRISLHDVKDPIVLWWTPFTGDMGSVKRCGNKRCFFTQDRRFKNHPLTKAYVFYGSQFDKFDLPLPRNWKKYSWALFHEESPKNIPAFSHAKALSIFNITATFSRHSHFPLTFQYLKDLDVLTGTKFYLPVELKDVLLDNLAPVVYVHSDCSTPLERDTYVAELMKYIKVDSYGACLQNKKLPEYLTEPMQGMDSEDFYHILAQYKFTITFENAVCEDYVTEKLWRTLTVGSVPVYMGSPSVMDWLPNNNSAILVENFSSPKELADYLKEVNRDPKKYEEFLQHKIGPTEKRITNKKLKEAMEQRVWGIDGDFEKINMIDAFECFICKNMDKEPPLPPVDIHHYYCPRPVSPLTKQENRSNFWLEQWYSGRCEAEILRNYIDNDVTDFTRDEFDDKMDKMFFDKTC